MIFSRSNVTKIGAVVNSSFSLLKAAIASVFIKNTSPFFIISVKGITTLKYTLINLR